MDKKIIHAFPKNTDEEIRLSAGEFKEKIYLDLRIFYRDQETDEMRPTKRGITLALDHFSELKKGIDKINPKELTAAAGKQS